MITIRLPFRRHSINLKICALLLAIGLCASTSRAKINSGSDGHDGAFNPTQNVTIDMADHPDGIYEYTSVNIPSGVTVKFKPNVNNSPVIWLVQGDCSIGGNVDVSSGSSPGGFAGGNANPAAPGQGPGGGQSGTNFTMGGNASYGTIGGVASVQAPAGNVYGNNFILPLLGGSGGGGQSSGTGGNGGGAILVAASGTIALNGYIVADGGGSFANTGGNVAGAGSGGAIRLIASVISGSGYISAGGGNAYFYNGGYYSSNAGGGRIRFDTYQNQFTGYFGGGVFTQGFQPIIIPVAGRGVQLSITSVGGNVVPTNPSGTLTNPDLIIPGQQNIPISIVVSCTNVPLNTEITVVVHPANGSDVQAVGLNNTGTAASSTATVSVNMPRGGGIIYAECVSGVAGGSGTNTANPSYSTTGLTANGERISTVKVTSQAGGKQRTTYVTPSGKSFAAPSN